MAASVEGTATCSPALQTLSLIQARHTISPPYFNQRLSTCRQWENNLRRTLKRIIALLHGFEIRLCAQQTSYQLICRNSLLSWRVTVDWRNSLAPALFRHSGQHWCRNILNSVTSPWPPLWLGPQLQWTSFGGGPACKRLRTPGVRHDYRIINWLY